MSLIDLPKFLNANDKENKIDLPHFLTHSDDKIELPNFLKKNERCTKCQSSCEPHSQCGTCQYCQSSCQTSCNGSSMACNSGCQVSCQSSCEKGCQTLCERRCQSSCQVASQNNGCGSCQKCQSGCQTLCERSCQLFCQIADQCNSCQNNCQNSCQKNCQSKCEKNFQCSSACEKTSQSCSTSCEKKCQGCEYYNQCGNYESVCNYQEKPVSCNNGCQNQAESCKWILMSPCDLECQRCQDGCQKKCQSSCQVSSQCGSCESCEGCQSSCERRCQNCQSSCERRCQNCQTACERSVQHTHTFKTYYEQKNNKQHRKFDRCDADNYIINDILENHIYNNETIYEDGAIYQICTKCGYRNKLKDIPDFEWDIPKGSDTSDVCITHTEWNRFLDILSLKLESCRQDKDVEAIRVKKHEIVTAQKFNMVIDKLIFIKASNIPTKVDPNRLILPTTHLNGIRDSLNSVRKCT